MTEHIWFMDGHCETDIVHYGVKGMRWGVRKARPTGTRKKTGKFEVPDDVRRKMRMNNLKTIGSIVGTAAFVAGTAVAYTYMPATTTLALRAISLGSVGMTAIKILRKQHKLAKANSEPEKQLSDIRKMPPPPDTMDKAVKKVNGNMDKDIGCNMNCPMCSMAIDLRRRGYDVHAIRTDDGLTNSQIENCYKDAHFKTVHVKSATGKIEPTDVKQSTVDTIKADGDCRGFITNAWKKGGGHCYNYECKDGEVTFFDGQSKVSGKDLDWYFNEVIPTEMTIMRTDDKEPSDIISRYVRESEENAA